MGAVKNFMTALDEWTEAIIEPYAEAVASGDQKAISEAKRRVLLGVRGKVLESYHNGQNAIPRANQRPFPARR